MQRLWITEEEISPWRHTHIDNCAYSQLYAVRDPERKCATGLVARFWNVLELYCVTDCEQMFQVAIPRTLQKYRPIGAWLRLSVRKEYRKAIQDLIDRIDAHGVRPFPR